MSNGNNPFNPFYSGNASGRRSSGFLVQMEPPPNRPNGDILNLFQAEAVYVFNSPGEFKIDHGRQGEREGQGRHREPPPPRGMGRPSASVQPPNGTFRGPAVVPSSAQSGGWLMRSGSGFGNTSSREPPMPIFGYAAAPQRPRPISGMCGMGVPAPFQGMSSTTPDPPSSSSLSPTLSPLFGQGGQYVLRRP